MIGVRDFLPAWLYDEIVDETAPSVEEEEVGSSLIALVWSPTTEKYYVVLDMIGLEGRASKGFNTIAEARPDFSHAVRIAMEQERGNRG